MNSNLIDFAAYREKRGGKDAVRRLLTGAEDPASARSREEVAAAIQRVGQRVAADDERIRRMESGGRV